MSDAGHAYADDRIAELESRFRAVYSQAEAEMRAKLDQFAADYERKLGEFDARMAAAKTNDEFMALYGEFQDWKSRQAAAEQWLRDMVASLADSVVRADQMAAAAIRDDVPRVFAENANYAIFDIESGIGMRTMFNLMDEDTARYLMSSDAPELFPRVDMTKDRVANSRRLTSAVTQGILQGESIPKIADRLRTVSDMGMRAAVRAARTACTAAENAGRVSSYQRAERMGIRLKQEWLATLDMRTRASHRQLDGVKVEVGGTFQTENGPLRFPADPEGPAAEVYNCRCTLVAAVEDVDQSAADRFSRLPDGMTYEQWKGYVEQTADERPVAPDIPRFTGGQSNIAQTCGQQFVDGMADTLEQHGTDRTRRLFNQYEDELVVKNAKSRGGAYCNGRHGVTFNARIIARGDMCHAPYQNAFHEFAHNIDGIIAHQAPNMSNTVKALGAYSYGWRDNALGKSIQAEWDYKVTQTLAKSHERITAEEEKFKRLLSKMKERDGVDYRAIRRQLTKGETTADEIMQAHGEEIARAWIEESKRNRARAYDITVGEMRRELAERGLSGDLRTVGSLSDVVEGCTRTQYPFGVGHGKRYWGEHEYHQPSEFFAEVVDGQSANDASYQLMREVFPNSCDMVNEMIEEVLQ